MSTAQQPSGQPHLGSSGADGIWPPRLGRIVFGALLAGGIGWVILKSVYPIFEVPPEMAILPNPPPTEKIIELEKVQYAIDGQNFSIVFGLTGAVLGAYCAVFAFVAKGLRPLLIAAIAAGALGVVGANLSNEIFTRIRLTSGSDRVLLGITFDAMKQAILGYASLWGLIGLGVGVGVGSFRGGAEMVTSGIAGLAGGFVTAMLYVLGVGQLSPNESMSHVFPLGSSSQVIWFLVFCMGIAAAIALGSGENAKRQDSMQTDSRDQEPLLY